MKNTLAQFIKSLLNPDYRTALERSLAQARFELEDAEKAREEWAAATAALRARVLRLERALNNLEGGSHG